MSPVIMENTVFYGDNLEILRYYFIGAYVDLTSLDPALHLNHNNVQLIDKHGLAREANITTFEDTWQ